MVVSNDSAFESLKIREIRPTKVRKRPYLGNMTSEEGGHGCGVLTGEPNCVSSPALAVSFGKTNGGSHMLAVSDEEGYMSLFNTRRRLPSSLTCEQNTGDVRTELWRAHNNAIFDICWIRDDTRILSASGDQTIRLWDVQARAGLGVMKGHTGSVKSLCSHPVHPDLFVSGSRDGSVAFWDVRSNSTSSDRTSEECFQPIASIQDAHVAIQRRRVNRNKVASKSITAVVYLKDERVVASAGAADRVYSSVARQGDFECFLILQVLYVNPITCLYFNCLIVCCYFSVVKFWDTRKLKAPIAQTPPQCQPNIEGKEGRVHGIASLSQDSNGAFLISSCMDNKIYLYNMLQPERGPLKSFSGHVLSSFYVKAAFSPDGTHILSGSSDGNVFIWQADKPAAVPVILQGHGGEVTAVDWCPSDFCKVATCSDDYTVRVWNIENSSFENQRSTPSAVRRRISAYPASVSQRLFDSIAATDSAKLHPDFLTGDSDGACADSDKSVTPQSLRNDEVTTPQSIKNVVSRALSLGSPSNRPSRNISQTGKENEALIQKTPENMKSPSSVLNPPSSSKRKTILDYFGTN